MIVDNSKKLLDGIFFFNCSTISYFRLVLLLYHILECALIWWFSKTGLVFMDWHSFMVCSLYAPLDTHHVVLHLKGKKINCKSKTMYMFLFFNIIPPHHLYIIKGVSRKTPVLQRSRTYSCLTIKFLSSKRQPTLNFDRFQKRNLAINQNHYYFLNSQHASFNFFFSLIIINLNTTQAGCPAELTQITLD